MNVLITIHQSKCIIANFRGKSQNRNDTATIYRAKKRICIAACKGWSEVETNFVKNIVDSFSGYWPLFPLNLHQFFGNLFWSKQQWLLRHLSSQNHFEYPRLNLQECAPQPEIRGAGKLPACHK